MDRIPPKISHGFQEDDGRTEVFYADVFDRTRIAEVMGIALKKRGRPRLPRLPRGVLLSEGMKGLRPEDVIWPEKVDPDLKAAIVARMKNGD